MTAEVQHIRGHTYHGRKGALRNAFRYGVDYVLLDAEAEIRGPALFSRNAANVVSVADRDHGGPPSAGRGAAWVRDALRRHGLPQAGRILLLCQPRVLGHDFNPVSFWLCRSDAGALYAVIAEVTNTFGTRHAYLCHHSDLRPIEAADRIEARKVLHVSPFQPVAGTYTFRFDIRPDRLGIGIDYQRPDGGLVATLTGHPAPLTNRGILGMLLRRPIGARRVLALIHWQAARLWWKGARFRPEPDPPASEISRG